MSALSQEVLERNPTEEEKKTIDDELSISKRQYPIELSSVRALRESSGSQSKSVKSERQAPIEQQKQETISNEGNPSNPFLQSQEKPNIFGSKSKPAGNIFGEEEAKSTNIFASVVMERGEKNLFEKTPTTVNLFEPRASAAKSGKQELPNPSINLLAGLAKSTNDEESGSQLEECESVVQEEEKCDPKESKGSYNYESDYTRVFSARVTRFKANQDPLQTDLVLSVEKPKNNIGWSALVMRNNGTGLIVYQALMIPSKTKVEHFMDKKENAVIKVWKKSQEKDSNKFQQQVVKIQFAETDKCQEFADRIKGLAADCEPSASKSQMSQESNTIILKSNQKPSPVKSPLKSQAVPAADVIPKIEHISEAPAPMPTDQAE